MIFLVSNWDMREPQARLSEQKPGKVYSVEIKLLGTYTKQQQWYYWWVCLKRIADYCGYTRKQWFYLWWLEIVMDGKEYLHYIIKAINRRSTSTDCSIEEYGELIDTAIVIAERLGIDIPPPPFKNNQQ